MCGTPERPRKQAPMWLPAQQMRAVRRLCCTASSIVADMRGPHVKHPAPAPGFSSHVAVCTAAESFNCKVVLTQHPPC